MSDGHNILDVPTPTCFFRCDITRDFDPDVLKPKTPPDVSADVKKPFFFYRDFVIYSVQVSNASSLDITEVSLWPKVLMELGEWRPPDHRGVHWRIRSPDGWPNILRPGGKCVLYAEAAASDLIPVLTAAQGRIYFLISFCQGDETFSKISVQAPPPTFTSEAGEDPPKFPDTTLLKSFSCFKKFKVSHSQDIDGEGHCRLLKQLKEGLGQNLGMWLEAKVDKSVFLTCCNPGRSDTYLSHCSVEVKATDSFCSDVIAWSPSRAQLGCITSVLSRLIRRDFAIIQEGDQQLSQRELLSAQADALAMELETLVRFGNKLMAERCREWKNEKTTDAGACEDEFNLAALKVHGSLNGRVVSADRSDYLEFRKELLNAQDSTDKLFSQSSSE